jgi:pimeloyl-ACP methyl ester carboxylesterase
MLYRFIRPLVESGYSVIAFDAPAHGESDGTTTSYFEFTDVVRAFIKADSGFDISAVIAHSLGAAAVINGLSKERTAVDTVLIAPALKLKEILYNTFDRYGIPANLYRNMIASFEKKYGYSLDHDNPVRLLRDLNRPVFIVHDRDDKMIPYMDSRKAAENHANVRVRITEGLGHKRILNDETVLEDVLQCLSGQWSRPVQQQMAR